MVHEAGRPSKGMATTVYHQGKQVVRLGSGHRGSEQLGVGGRHGQPRPSNQTSLNQTNSHSQIISPHFYRHDVGHGTQEEMFDVSGGELAAVIAGN